MMRFAFPILVSLTVCVGIRQSAFAQFIIGTPANLGSDVNGPVSELGGSISPDGLSLYYSTGKNWRVGRGTNYDLVVSHRAHVDAPWGPPETVSPVLSTRFDENVPELSHDGLSLYFADGAHPDVDGSMNLLPGGKGGADIWVSRRDSLSSAWMEPENLGEPINSRFHDSGPSASGDGKTLVFESRRPGGSGGSDLWVSSWQLETNTWSAPENLGAMVNSSAHDFQPEISSDGRTLFFISNRPSGGFSDTSIWVTTRDNENTPWRSPVRIENSSINSFETEWAPSLSHDGSSLYFARWEGSGERYGQDDIWQVPLLPLEKIDISGSGKSYVQNFDEALGVDGSVTETPLPQGWTGSDNGIVFDNTTTAGFPERRLSSQGAPLFNAGANDAADRALAIGATRLSDGGQLQLLANVVESDATTFRLRFDVEAWDVTTSSSPSNRKVPGEAAFHLTVEAKTSNGYENLYDFGVVTTGQTLQPGEADYLDGNAEPYRTSFDSGLLKTDISPDTTLRIRWAIPPESETTGWIFGLDNVELSLGASSMTGDLNEDGLCDVGDIDLLTSAVLSGSDDPSFDLNNDGAVSNDDRHTWVKDIKQTYFGDSNLDNEFNTTDLIEVFQSGEYEDNIAMNSGWRDGDWNGDGEFGTEDLVVAFQDGGYEQGPVGGANSVPESSSAIPVALATITYWLRLVPSRSKTHQQNREPCR